MGVLLRRQRHDVARRQHRDADCNTGTWSHRVERHVRCGVTNARSCRGGCTLCRDRRPVRRWRRVRGRACDGNRKSSSCGVGHTHVVPPERNGPFGCLAHSHVRAAEATGGHRLTAPTIRLAVSRSSSRVLREKPVTPTHSLCFIIARSLFPRSLFSGSFATWV
jgi:hypothetical protein